MHLYNKLNINSIELHRPQKQETLLPVPTTALSALMYAFYLDTQFCIKTYKNYFYRKTEPKLERSDHYPDWKVTTSDIHYLKINPATAKSCVISCSCFGQ